MYSEAHIDLETRSKVDLRAVGLYVYAQHPSTEVLCMAYAFDDEGPKLWTPADPMPQELINHISAGGMCVAHNSYFERVLIRDKLTKLGLPEVPINQWRCTMVQAYAMALPGSLEEAANALGMALGKDLEGRKLMLKMCKPRKVLCSCKGKEDDCLWCGGDPEVTWWDDQELHDRLGQYCIQDVRVEREIDKRTLRLRPSEALLWHLDAKINDTGVYIDKALCDAASKVVEDTMRSLNREMKSICGCETMEVSQLAKWITERLGKPVLSVNKEAILEMLGSWDLPDDVRRALELRQEAGKTSNAKIPKMLEMRGEGGRMRGNLQFHGAGTGRWAARGAQLQNLPRPKTEDVNGAIKLILDTKDYQIVDLMYGPPLSVVSDCIRGMIGCEKAKVMLSADFSNIEGRVLAWLAGQQDKLEAFKAFDAGTGPDLYLVAAAGIFGCKPELAKPFRQIGKVAELSMGYQGGPNAFAKMGGNYGLHIGKHYDVVWANAREDHKTTALTGYDLRGKKSDMTKEAWLAAEVIKVAWREVNNRIQEYWWLLESAAFAAVKNPGSVQKVIGLNMPEISYKVSGSFLFCRLPSGRAIVYPYPRLKNVKTDWGTNKETIVYKCVDALTRKWADKNFYGGLAAENITQAVARDIMAEAMFTLDEMSYTIVNTVHDEIICEVEAQFADLSEFIEYMQMPPEWAKGCPIAASGWVGERYKK